MTVIIAKSSTYFKMLHNLLSLGGSHPAAGYRHPEQGDYHQLHSRAPLPQSPLSYTDSGGAWSPSL